MSYSSITEQSWHQRRRALVDKVARHTIGLGGISIIFAVVLIFFYLLWVVAPIFSSPEIKPVGEFQAPATSVSPVYLAIEESGHLALRVTANGDFTFVDLLKGQVAATESIDLPEYSSVIQVVEIEPTGRELALALDNSRVLFVNVKYRVSFVDDERVLTPVVSFPYGEEALELNYIDQLTKLAVVRQEERLRLAALAMDGKLLLQEFEVEEDEELSAPETEVVFDVALNPKFMMLDPQGEWLYVANELGQVNYYNVSDFEEVEQVDQLILIEPDRQLVSLSMLLGGISLLAADDMGRVAQWTLQRDDKNQYRLKEIRAFKTSAQAAFVMPEKRRKGMISINDNGEVIIYHTTAERVLLEEPLLDFKPINAVIAPRANYLLVESADNKLYSYHVENPHPELSWKALWQELMYEGYDEPKFIWQSSSADNDFEPKFSLAPLAYGTLKAAFYAMLFAIPLAIMGAIYTAYFMAPKMRNWVKPSIEIMEALPTVILGFLAGLWFAPIVEDNLLAILSLLIVLPVGLLGFAWLWTHLPKPYRYLVPEGWQAALLIPVIIALVWIAFAAAPWFEEILFAGNIRGWMKAEFGIGYDQRNALVVGIAMGMAVIPTIFSITEDAIFSVPKALTNGSLALGATPWQTLTRVVLLTASPGIFSAVMIGFGRAVGETMIVLMATGNTPVMDMSIFEGMRTLSANIAVELPESEVDSTHYRILFLAALVLFVVTFMFNTIAELVRQRLRKRYGSL